VRRLSGAGGLPATELAELCAGHGATRDKREADRIKAVILLASGWRAEAIADALLVDANTVRNHFKHNPVLGYGWIKRGEDREVRSNTGRRRLNINGAIDLERLEPVVRYDDTIDATSTIALFDQLLLAYAYATCIYVICDNARYYRSKAVQEYLRDSRIQLVFCAGSAEIGILPCRF
jgi:hypothetical protein